MSDTACAECGAPFTPRTHRSRFCTRQCGMRWRARHVYAAHPDPRPCEMCGTTFVPKSYRSRFCSEQCGERWRWRAKYKTALAAIACDECGEPFVPATVKSRFCSQRCLKRNYARERYAPTLYARRQAGEVTRPTACAECGWAIAPAILELHHRDRDRQNNGDTNLAWLCPTCHRLAHYREGTGGHRTPHPE